MDIDLVLGEDAFLSMHPLIQRVPKELINLPGIVRQYHGYVVATVRFEAYKNEVISIEEEVSISIPSSYPIELPIVFILDHGNVIKLGADYHFYQNSGQLCLGNSWEIRKELLRDPTLNNLMSSLVIPHIAGATYKLIYGKSFPQGEFSHGLAGKLESLASFFSTPQNEEIIINILNFLKHTKRVANKMLCPFGCNKEYAKCRCKGDFQDLKILFPTKEVDDILREIEFSKIIRKTQLMPH